MPVADSDGVAVHYGVAEDGETVANGSETVALLADVGYGPWAWSWQHPALAGPFETLVVATRGTGRSDAGTGRSDSPPGPYSVADLAADLEAVLADHGARSAHLVGAGLGGAVALSHALRYDRARSLALLGATADGAGLDLAAGFATPADDAALLASLRRACSARFLSRQPDALRQMVAWRRAEDAVGETWRAHAAALAGFDATDRLYEVDVPALVVHGTADRVVPVERGAALAAGLPRGRLERRAGAGHLVGVEHSAAVNDLLVGFLEAHGGDG